jgi:hypothetical protein
MSIQENGSGKLFQVKVGEKVAQVGNHTFFFYFMAIPSELLD